MGVALLAQFEAQSVLAPDNGKYGVEGQKQMQKRGDSKSIVLKETKHVAEIVVGPDCFDCFDDLLLFSIFRRTPVFHEKGYEYGGGEHIEVKILVISRST